MKNVLIIIFALWAVHSLAQEEFNCTQDTVAESGSFMSDVSLFFINVTKAPQDSNTSHMCDFGLTPSGWGEGKTNPPLPCNVTITGSTVLVKDLGATIRLAIDNASFTTRRPGKGFRSDQPKPNVERVIPSSAFATIEEIILNEEGASKRKLKAYRLSCTPKSL